MPCLVCIYILLLPYGHYDGPGGSSLFCNARVIITLGATSPTVTFERADLSPADELVDSAWRHMVYSRIEPHLAKKQVLSFISNSNSLMAVSTWNPLKFLHIKTVPGIKI